jgi:hypothetical protein
MKKILAAVFCLSISAGAFAEWEHYSVGPVNGWSAYPAAKSVLLLQPYIYYANTYGEYDNAGNYGILANGESRKSWQYSLLASYGLSDRMDISAQTGLIWNYKKTGGHSAKSTGLTDSNIALRYVLWAETEKRPNIAGFANFSLPTGKYQDGDDAKLGTDIKGTGAFVQGYGLLFGKQLEPFVLHADAYYSFPFSTTVNGVKTKYGNYLNYDAAAEYFATKNIHFQLELNGVYRADNTLDGVKTANTGSRSLTIMPAVGYSTGKVQSILGYQRNLCGKNTDAVETMVLTVVFNF